MSFSSSNAQSSALFDVEALNTDLWIWKILNLKFFPCFGAMFSKPENKYTMSQKLHHFIFAIILSNQNILK